MLIALNATAQERKRQNSLKGIETRLSPTANQLLFLRKRQNSLKGIETYLEIVVKCLLYLAETPEFPERD